MFISNFDDSALLSLYPIRNDGVGILSFIKKDFFEPAVHFWFLKCVKFQVTVMCNGEIDINRCCGFP